MKALTLLSAIMLLFSLSCNHSVEDNQEKIQQREQLDSHHYNPENDPNINSLSNQPANREGL
jgi:hypothetical protein